MKTFIDESGSFGSAKGKGYSISCVGALTIADCHFKRLEKKYLQIRPSLPKDKNGEVKGRLLNEQQVSKIIDLLRRNDALFEAVLIDMNIQDQNILQEQKSILKSNHRSRLRPETQDKYRRTLNMLDEKLEAMSPQLFAQFTLSTKLLNRVLQHAVTYFSLRQPKELGNFEWYVDAKGADSLTNAESWWRLTISPFLATASVKDGGPIIPYGDYTYYDEAYGAMIEDWPEIEGVKSTNGTDLKKVFSKFHFISDFNTGLELADIVTNTLRRALTGNLEENGWRSLPEIVIHRADQPSIPFLVIADDNIQKSVPYARVYQRISIGRKSMMTSRVSELVAAEIAATGS